MRTIIHNYFPTRDEPEFVEAEHPREKGGQFTSGGGGGGGKGTEGQKQFPSRIAAKRLEVASNLKSASTKRAVARTKRFLSNTRVQKQVGRAASEFMIHHTIGAAGSVVTHSIILGAIHQGIDHALTHYAMNGPTTAAIATGVAGYAVHEFMEATGATPHNAVKLMVHVVKSLVQRYNTLNPSIPGDAAPEDEDSVLAGLKQFLKVLESTKPEDLVKAAKKPESK
jgi:hypothetical protein